MELYDQIRNRLTTHETTKEAADYLVGKACYIALSEIRAALHDDSLEYIDFYDKIEEIVYRLENGDDPIPE